MKIHHLGLDDSSNEYFHIIAIYSDEEDYRMAFLLNQHLNILLKRAIPILIKKDQAKFSVFEYEDVTLYRNWLLLQNQSLIEKEIVKHNDLFSQNTTQFHQKTFYFKELKKARFLLKIVTDEGSEFLKELTEKLQNIPQIYTIELVHLAQVKNTKLLLF